MPLVGIHTLTDKYGFQCFSCNKRISIRIGSTFYKSKLSLYEILRILVGFVSNTNAIKLSENISISRKCIGKWYHTFRCLIATYLESIFRQLGGTDTIVEIDESVIGRRKYNVGRHRDQQWLFGCIESQTSKIFIKCIDTRTKNELGSIIKDVIADETIVMSDQWPAYMSFFGDAQTYNHYSVNHSQNFVNPITGAHTQNIERIWGKLKQR